MLLWMALLLVLRSRAYGRRVSLTATRTRIGNQHSYAFIVPPVYSASVPYGSISSTTRLLARGKGPAMRGVKKENLPTKVCVVCNRPFTWRKKWERCWDEVTTCSKSCNSKRKGRKSESALDSVKKDHADTPQSRKDLHIYDSNAKAEQIEVTSMLAANLENLHVNEDTLDDIRENELERLVADASYPELDMNLEASDQDHAHNELDDHGDPKARRKAEKKKMKAMRRAQREGRGDPSAGQKQCTICSKSVNLLIRCTYDSTEEWGMVCGQCWNDVSGGVVDGDAAHPHYRYGGLWKNRRAQKA